MINEYLDINPEVEAALVRGEPVVALESTIIAHGMPYPKNVETALRVHQVIRENGAVPATVGIIGGRIKVGLTDEEIEYMGKTDDVAKISRRDLPFVLARGGDGAADKARGRARHGDMQAGSAASLRRRGQDLGHAAIQGSTAPGPQDYRERAVASGAGQDD